MLARTLIVSAALWAAGAEAQTLSVSKVLKERSPFNGVAISPNGDFALTWSSEAVRFWDLKTATALPERETETMRRCTSNAGSWLSPDGALLALACDGIVLVDLRIPKMVARLGEGFGLRAVGFDREGRNLATVFDVNGRPKVQVFDIAAYADPSWFGALVRDWFGYDSNDPDEEFTIDDASERYDSVNFAPNPAHLVLHTRKSFELRTTNGELVSSTPSSDFPFLEPACQRTGGLQSQAIAKMLERLAYETRRKVDHCHFDRDGSQVFLIQGDELSSWNTRTGKQEWAYRGEPSARYLATTPDRKRLAIADSAGHLALLTADGSLISKSEGSQSRAGCDPGQKLAMSADGRTIISVDCAAFIWRLE